MKIFFSYPHDDNAAFVKRLKQDLEARGHEVWFDEAEIKAGDDWRNAITRGILESETVVAFLSKHAVRDPGVCLNEIAITLAEKGDEAIVTVLVEPEKEVSAPVSITHIQWLKMEDHLTQALDEGWYRTHFDKLVQVIENPSSVTRHDELGTLKDVLHPLSFNADIGSHLARFTGRQWLVARYEDWLSKPSPSNANKVFRIEGGPGMGKTAVASYLAHATKSSVLGVHLCKSGSAITHNPGQLVLSLAYQMATRLPDYRARLLKVPYIKNPDLMKDEDAGSLWDMLISEPLAGAGKAGLIDRQRLAIVIDGLDEATKNGQNPIVELLVDHIQTLPSWVGVVLTGRPDPELTQSLKHYTPQVINGDNPANVEDLRNYIDAWLQDEVQAKRLQAHQVPAATQALLQKSEGAFLYLAQAREEALQSNADGSASYYLSNPASLPSGLNALYQKSFRRRFPDVASDSDNPASRWNALVKPLLGFILASPEPLPLDLARELMGWDTDTAGNEKQHKAMQALGSLIKRNGNTEKPETCTLAPFHHSVREWLTSENSQGFRVFIDTARYPLTEVTWKRCLRNNVRSIKDDSYAFRLLQKLLPEISQNHQDSVLGKPNYQNSNFLSQIFDQWSFYDCPKSSWIAFSMLLTRYKQALLNLDTSNFIVALDLNETMNVTASLLVANDRKDEGNDLRQEALRIIEAYFRSDSSNIEYNYGYFWALDRKGRSINIVEQRFPGKKEERLNVLEIQFARAEFLVNSAPTKTPYLLALAYVCSRVGRVLDRLGRTPELLEHYQRGLEVLEILAGLPTAAGQTEIVISSCFNDLGMVLNKLGRRVEAANVFVRELTIIELLVAKTPALAIDLFNISIRDCKKLIELNCAERVPSHFQYIAGNLMDIAAANDDRLPPTIDLSEALTKFGESAEELGFLEQAEGAYRLTVKIVGDCLDDLGSSYQSSRRCHQMCLALSKLGSLLGSSGRKEDALRHHKLAWGLSSQSLTLYPGHEFIAEALHQSSNDVESIMRELGLEEERLLHIRHAVSVATAQFQVETQSVQSSVFSVSHLAQLLHDLGENLVSLGKLDEAQSALKQNLEISEYMFKSAPDLNWTGRYVANSYNKLGDLQRSLGNSQAALALYQQGLEIAQRLSNSAPENAEFARDLSISYERLGNMQQTLGNSQAALTLYQQGLEIRERLSSSAPENAQFTRDVAFSYWKMASISEGDEQRKWWIKLHAALSSMDERGILPESDKEDLAEVKLKLGIA